MNSKQKLGKIVELVGALLVVAGGIADLAHPWICAAIVGGAGALYAGNWMRTGSKSVSL